MDQFRRVLTTIQMQLGKLTVSQRLLVGSLAVIVLMSLFLVSQYAGTSQMVELLPGSTPEEQQRAVSFLQNAGIQTSAKNGNVYVAADRRYIALAELQRGQKMPADKKLLIGGLIDKQNWMIPSKQLDQMYNAAVQNELAKIIANFPGVESADVFISNPPQQGIGAPARRPTATVTVHTASGSTLSQDTVDSLADLIAGSTAGLSSSEVRVVDSAKGRRYRPRSQEDLSSGTYFEQAMRVEERVRQRILASLEYIADVNVAVNAQVDVVSKTSREHLVLPKGKGSESAVASDSTTTNAQTQPGGGGIPGVQSNVTMSISGSGAAAGNSSTEETADTKMDNQWGTKDTQASDPSGRPTRINVAVGIPMSWVAQIVKQRKAKAVAPGGGDTATGEPTMDEILEAWDKPGDAKQRGEKQRLEELLQPLVDTAAAEGGGSGASKVVVSMIPVLTPASGGGGGSGGSGSSQAGIFSGGAAGTLGSLAQGPLLKTALLGGLAVLALGMMVVMVRKSARPDPLPTAEELAGVPPKLHADSDLVGEAGEGDTAMLGIEIDDDSLKSKKMLEQVSDLIQKNPGEAATVFNRWLATES